MIEESPTDASSLEAVLAAAAAAARPLADQTPAQRAALLRSIAAGLEVQAPALIDVAGRETNLPQPRLQAELARTVFQLRFLAAEVEQAVFTDAIIDHADPDWPMGARPDLRRINVPVGPVLVYAASNFPFAFSVVGGDTASALAAGCPVVLKAHPYHPELSLMTAAAVLEGVRAAGAPDGTFALIAGRDQGIAALLDERIAAAAFTGSLAGGRALFDIAASRPHPIPFFGELSSVNPVFVTEAAAASRAAEVAAGLAGSFTMGAGQFCTKPGIVFLPHSSDIISETTRILADAVPAPMLHPGIVSGYQATLSSLRSSAGVSTVTQVPGTDDMSPGATVLSTPSANFASQFERLGTECFGPTVLFVEYRNASELPALAALFHGELTATVQGADDESGAEVAELLALLGDRVGRVLWNQWSTGVSVTHAQVHGGPYPATTDAATTSVGTTAVRRFLRPVAYQGMPDQLLPAELQDSNPRQIPRRVDGLFVAAPKGAS